VEATEALRGLRDAIILTPTDVELKSNWRGTWRRCWKCEEVAGNRRPLAASWMVAGACNQRYLQLWSGAAWSPGRLV